MAEVKEESFQPLLPNRSQLVSFLIYFHSGLTHCLTLDFIELMKNFLLLELLLYELLLVVGNLV